MRQLQQIPKAAAWVLNKTKKVDHLTPVLRSLHWFSVCQRIYFKLGYFWVIKYWMVWGQNPLMICCYIVNHADPSGHPEQVLFSTSETELNMKKQRPVFMLNISGFRENYRPAATFSSFKSSLNTFSMCHCLVFNQNFTYFLHCTVTFALEFLFFFIYWSNCVIVWWISYVIVNQSSS